MRIKQYVYFGIFSEQVPAVDVTARLRVEPDEVRVRGSRSVQPVRPVAHSWHVRCDEAGLTVDDQIERVVGRLEPVAGEIGALVAELAAAGSGAAVLQVVRHFGHSSGEEDDGGVVDGAERFAGQHQLLGWHLDPRVVDFLVRTHAELNVDEYG